MTSRFSIEKEESLNLPENDFQILKLTDLFYEAYPNNLYPELLEKRQRAYNCLLFQTHYDFFICIPYRSEISHPFAFHFKKSKRSQKHKSGLDYTKIIIIKNHTFIDNKSAVIDQDEYKETILYFERIKKEALEYVEKYILHMKGIKEMDSFKFNRQYGYSTLKYFHKELNLK